MKAPTDSRNRSAKRRACPLLIPRFPLNTCVATAGNPDTSNNSTGRKPFCSIRTLTTSTRVDVGGCTVRSSYSVQRCARSACNSRSSASSFPPSSIASSASNSAAKSSNSSLFWRIRGRYLPSKRPYFFSLIRPLVPRVPLVLALRQQHLDINPLIPPTPKHFIAGDLFMGQFTRHHCPTTRK